MVIGNGSLDGHPSSSYSSSIATIAMSCIVFEIK